MLNFEDIKNNKEISAYLKYTDDVFASIGYKEHGIRHALHAANTAAFVLGRLGYDKRKQELAKIAGYMHDIGNLIAKRDHWQSGAIITLNLLKEIYEESSKYYFDIFEVFGAIGSHEDKHMQPPTEIAAAVILGDKTDVHHERLRSEDKRLEDQHSKVVSACENSLIEVSKADKLITLKIDINTDICPIMEYFEIFTSRTNFCRKASNVLDCEFSLYINGDKFL